MGQVFKAECEASGIEPNEVRSIVRRLERAAKDANELGLYIFGGDARCTLRVAGPVRAGLEGIFNGPLVVAVLDESNFDGGDVGFGPGSDKLMRGKK